MADVAAPSPAADKTADPSKVKAASAAASKPERPNDEEFKAKLAKAEKDLRASEDRMVCVSGGWA